MNAFALGMALREHHLAPYTSWEIVHADFSVVSQMPEALNTPINYITNVVSFYAGPLYSIVFFAFFGLGEEAISEYAAMWLRIQSAMGYFGWKINRSVRNRINDGLFCAKTLSQTLILALVSSPSSRLKGRLRLGLTVGSGSSVSVTRRRGDVCLPTHHEAALVSRRYSGASGAIDCLRQGPGWVGFDG
jgi:hypothetical protein